MEQRQERQAAAARLDALHEFAARFAAPSSGVTRTLDAVAAEVLAAFRQAGVEALLLKGRALAILLYRAGEQRGYSHVDLLVAPDDLDAAEATLRGLGYENASSAQGIDDIGGVVHADTWIRATPGSNDQAMIDLHRWLPGARATPGTTVFSPCCQTSQPCAPRVTTTPRRCERDIASIERPVRSASICAS